MCEEIGIPTTIDLDALIQLSRTLPALLGHDTPSQLAKAGRNTDLHPIRIISNHLIKIRHSR